MSLLDLPDETLHSIIEIIVPESLDDIALTCKKLWNNCQSFLEKYNKLRKRFRHVKYTRSRYITKYEPPKCDDGYDEAQEVLSDNAGIQIDNVIQLLLYIAAEPTAARYIQSAYLWKDDLSFETPTWSVNPYGEFYPILSLLRQSPYLEKCEEDPDDWFFHIRHKYYAYADVFLLTLLPNVKILTPSIRLDNMFVKRHKTLLVQVAEWANDSTKLFPSLSKLEVIQLLIATERLVFYAEKHFVGIFDQVFS